MSDNSNDKSEQANATGEFFSVGSPLHAVRAGYVQRRADELLYEAVIAGRYAHVIAPDRSGKSSLIAATAARLENNGLHVAVLNLEQLGDRDGGRDAGRWYYSVAYRLLRQLRIRFDLQGWWQDKAVLGNRQRLLEFYSEIVLQNLQHRVVIFVDEIQCIGQLRFGDELLTSIRLAHNARTTDPDFGRLTFVLLGECDPTNLVAEPELSPFSVTQSIALSDFARADLSLFATELNLEPDDAETALERIFYWTRGQPYLSQKLARAVAREGLSGDIAVHVDRIVGHQLAGRAAFYSEPHMSHIHREILADPKESEALLNLYGRIRKGIEVPADLGSKPQRRLMAVGLLIVDEAGELKVRNRVYERVFTARWANENLPTHWRTPALVMAALFLVTIIPLWYTQWLPLPYQNVLVSMETELAVAESAWTNLRSFPGHADIADRLYRSFLGGRAAISQSATDMQHIATHASQLPDAGNLPQRLSAEFWDRRTRQAMREQRRDSALIASLESLVLSTPQRRNRSALLVGDDYPLLLASLARPAASSLVFNPGSLLLSASEGAEVSQWSLSPQGLVRNEPWTITALEVQPLVRRVIVDRDGIASRLGLALNISHPRLVDLRIKLIAPSGRAVEIEIDQERASSNEEMRIATSQLNGLLGETLRGTWSLSLRDVATGVAGHLVAWNLNLNSQGLVEDFQRGLGIPDPVEREADQIWIGDDGRYAVARTTRSDSARLWDLAFAKPVSTLAISESEHLIGLDSDSRHLVTATLETVNLWDIATGKRSKSLPVGPTSAASTLTADKRHIFVQHHGDADTRLELWDIDVAEKDSELLIAGAPALVALDASGQHIAIADFDRAVRIWDFLSGELLAQIDLPLQPSAISLNAAGDALGVVFSTAGVAAWSLADTQSPLMEEYGDGRWQLQFSPSGAQFVAGRPDAGLQMFTTHDGRLAGPPLGVENTGSSNRLLAFGGDEDVLVTGSPDSAVRFWALRRAARVPVVDGSRHAPRTAWGDAVVAAMPNAATIAVGDRLGHVHFITADASSEAINAADEDVSFLGHNAAVQHLAVSKDGRQVASVGADNSLRVWNTADGLPRSFIGHLPGTTTDSLRFSTDGSLIGVLSTHWAGIIDAASGDVLVERHLDEAHKAIAFGSNNELYLGSASGVLSVLGRDPSGAWSSRRLWQTESAIRALQVSPRGRFLVLVDQSNVARQFNLAAGQIGNTSLQLASAVEEIAFSPAGSRVLFRTARWVHRANSSSHGLTWVDALFAPKVHSGARIVFGSDATNSNPAGSYFYLPVARESAVNLARLSFSGADGPGLFGNRTALLADWRLRIAAPEHGTDD